MKQSAYILMTAAAILILAIGAWVFVSNSGSADPKPTATATATPPPPAQNPPTEQDLAKSVAFPATFVAADENSITFVVEKDQLTLPIDKWTSLVALKSIKDIKPNSTIGVRLTADKKRVLVLNGTWMDQ